MKSETPKCRRCGRWLSSPAAVEAGIGATCQKKELYEATHEMHPDAIAPKRERQSKAAKLVRFAFGISVRR